MARFALWLWLVCWAAAAGAEVPVPPLKARVTDLTATLNAEQHAALEQSLTAFEAKKGSQIAILLVPSTQPEAIEQYSLRVVEAWKLGRKGIGDGILVLVAKNDRKLRIEVGYGLEGAIPDAIAKRIVADIIAPQFKQGKYYEGLQAGVARIVATLEGEPLPPPKVGKKPADGASDWWGLVAIAALVGGGLLRAMFGALFGALVAGSIAGGVAWLLVGSVVLGGGAALVVFVITLFGIGSGLGGGWSSGSSSDGGGFSGGGGDFGGGGASGDW